MVNQEEINNRFLEAIRFLKSEYGYTQEFIVEKARLGKSAISKIRSGENNVGDKTITKLCNAFKLNPQFFYGQSQQITKEQKAWDNVEKEISASHVHSDVAREEDPQPYIPTWAGTLIDIITKQIAENEILHRELKESFIEINELKKEINELKHQLQTLIDK